MIDDVWNSAHLKPFLQGGSRCSRLITTRNSDTLPARAKGIDLDAMRPDEATSLLGFNLPESENSGLQHLAQRLGEWPLLLKLVNATLRYRVHDFQQPFPAALAYVNTALDECGLMAFDHDNATERHQAVAKTLEVSLLMLDEGGHYGYACAGGNVGGVDEEMGGGEVISLNKKQLTFGKVLLSLLYRDHQNEKLREYRACNP